MFNLPHLVLFEKAPNQMTVVWKRSNTTTFRTAVRTFHASCTTCNLVCMLYAQFSSHWPHAHDHQMRVASRILYIYLINNHLYRNCKEMFQLNCFENIPNTRHAERCVHTYIASLRNYAFFFCWLSMSSESKPKWTGIRHTIEWAKQANSTRNNE